MPSRVRFSGETLEKYLLYGKGRKMDQNKNEMTNWQDLFKLYRDLVAPFSKLEKLSSRKRELEYKADFEKNYIHFNYKRTIKDAISDTLKLKRIIPFLIVFWVIMSVVQVNGEKLFDYYDELLAGPMLGPIMDNKLYIYMGLFLPFIPEIIVLLIAFVLLPCLIFLFSWLFPLMMVRHVNYEKSRISKTKETIRICEEQLPLVEAAIQETWKIIAPHVGKVPPNYRNSHALAFFSNSFFNYKVKDLQEAVNLYDQYLHRQQMEQSQREMAEAQRRSMDALGDLSRQLDHMQDQINSQEPVVNNYYYYH